MKKFISFIILLVILLFLSTNDLLSTVTTAQAAITPTPTIEPIPIPDTIQECPDNGTIYPPNSVCYSKVKEVEKIGVNLFDSSDQFLTYILSCIPGPIITYKEIYEGNNPPAYRNVKVITDLSQATLGFLGPDSTTLTTSSSDSLAKKYLFNALFDRPGTDPDAQKESFRTYWRMLSSLSQAQLKAYYLEKSDKDSSYYYVDKNKKQQKVKLKDLKSDLPFCLKRFGFESKNFFINCWESGLYTEQYLELIKKKPLIADAYDALLPFDFENSRAYLSNGSMVSEENIPYLRAVISGLKGYKSDIPGLFDYYTPEWAIRPLAVYPKFSKLFSEAGEEVQKQIIKLIASAKDNCDSPPKSSSVSSPKTYPSFTEISYTKSVPVTSQIVSSTSGHCECYQSDFYCRKRNCIGYSYDDCPANCLAVKGVDTIELSGSAVGKPITVFNNPNVTSLTDLILGGKPLVSNTSSNNIGQAIIDLINKISDKLISPVQPSFYKMLLPDFASESAAPKNLVNAPSIGNSGEPVDNKGSATVTTSGGNSINRENNLAQDTMYLLQNCWLVPGDQQSSSKCNGKKITAGVCDGVRFNEILGGSATPPSNTALSYYETYIVPKLTPDVVNAYLVAEEKTGVPCEVLAGIHFEEGGNNPFQSLQDGGPLGSMTLEESAIKAGQELNGKAGGSISDLDTLMFALSRYNGGGNSNCQGSTSCPAASSLERCGMTTKCATSIPDCHCVATSEVGSCRYSCGSGSFPWPIPYTYCPASKEGYDDPYVTSWWISPYHDSMYLLFTYDCTQTIPTIHARPGALTVALSIYLSSNSNP